MKNNKTPINTTNITNTNFLFVATSILWLFISIFIIYFIITAKSKLTKSITYKKAESSYNENTIKSKCYACEKQTCNSNGPYPSKCYDCERHSKSDSTIEYIMKYPTSTPKMTYV